jgi:hypothetical protein
MTDDALKIGILLFLTYKESPIHMRLSPLSHYAGPYSHLTQGAGLGVRSRSRYFGAQIITK